MVDLFPPEKYKVLKNGENDTVFIQFLKRKQGFDTLICRKKKERKMMKDRIELTFSSFWKRAQRRVRIKNGFLVDQT